MERRAFLKAGCKLCGIAGIGLALSAFSSCAPMPLYKTSAAESKVQIPLSLFDKSNLQIIRIADYPYDIAVRKNADGNFKALLMRCTHADNQLMSTGKGFLCTSHGSNFDSEGLVTKGPAERTLKSFTTEINNVFLVIHLS